MRPLVSVCIPTYNYERYLEEALSSVLSQSIDDIEVIVSDDASMDNTESLANKFVARDSRVRYIRHHSNMGLVLNWNYCLKIAQGRFIKFVFADDFLVAPTALEKLVKCFDNPKVVLAASSRRIVDCESKKLDSWFYAPDSLVVSGSKVIHECILKQKNLIGEPTAVLFKRNSANIGFDESLAQLADLEFWLRLLEGGDFAFINQDLCAFRKHDRQQTNVNIKRNIAFTEWWQLTNRYLNNQNFEISSFNKWYLTNDAYYQVYIKHKECDKSNNNLTVGFVSLFLYRLIKPIAKLLRRYLHVVK